MGSLWDQSSEALAQQEEAARNAARERAESLRSRTASLTEISIEFASIMHGLKVPVQNYKPVAYIRKSTTHAGPIPVRNSTIRGWLVKDSSATHSLDKNYSNPSTEVIITPDGLAFLRFQGHDHSSIFGVPIGVRPKPLWEADASHISERDLRSWMLERINYERNRRAGS